ncbi:hypothetical protein Dsin_013605 [Dipteronia sinensis]|uniref:ABC transporter domain-containing protein n=1 Tax=Dipteronia sinensis TaxID=43782 RepID=A0AAE0AL12_9ROSI|nr:hypothetical protein Dsin_013605 [Dipteronia sinensis]
MERGDLYQCRNSFRTNSFSLSKDSFTTAFSRSFREEESDEEALKWAALERLPTYSRLKKGLLSTQDGAYEVDVRKLASQERKALIDRLVRDAEEDNEKVGMDIPTLEVRFEHVNVDTEAYVGSRALPTFLNFFFNMIEALLNCLHLRARAKNHLSILHDVTGMIKPCRTVAYISQQDLHIPEMTVRETLSFSARCQGIGSRYEMLAELARREKTENIKPDPDVDVFMKAASTKGEETNVVTDYIIKVLGLEICADTMVGDDMLRGISGGQRKRVTTGELLVGPARVLLMDEISTGLDSSTTFQIVNSLKQFTHILKGTALISLLQPAPETYNLFDDIILLSDGQIVYQGPREQVLEFFESMGFKCPERKGVADFLQEVTSRKDQNQYWARMEESYSFVTVKEFSNAFQSFHVGNRLKFELSNPFDKSKSHPSLLTTNKYGVKRKELLKACFSKELLLMKRNSFVYIFKILQLITMALIGGTLFLRTEMHRDTIIDGGIYMGALFFSVVMIMFNGMAELGLTVFKLPVFYKQRDLLFYPAWAYAIPTWILKIPITVVEVGVWVLITYYVMGFDPNFQRFLKQYIVLFFTNQMASGLFRLIAGLGRELIVSYTFGSFTLLILFSNCGFVLSRALGTHQHVKSESQSTDHDDESGEATQSSSQGSSKEAAAKAMKEQGVTDDKLVLLREVSGSFRPGVLTALMGVSGAGKTTLMDVLAGRKTGGYIEGSIKISGYPKKQEAFARISGYCEQNDIHSPHVTIYESLVYSAWLRLPQEVNKETKKMFIEEVMELVELSTLKGIIVGLPGVNGLSTEQRKRLTIAVELVANPSIIFMDEPTSGLDARSAAIVMRTVRNTVNTGRTVVCTIHQPSIDIFEAFDELLLLKRGGQEIYVGPLGRQSCHLIKYFQSFISQCMACLWKQHLSYWRNPQYTAVRIFFTTVTALMFGSMYWDLGAKRGKQQDIINAMGSMYTAVLFLGVQNAGAVQPVVAVERTVFYRERAAGMYSTFPYAFAQVAIEVPYIFQQALTYGVIVYSMIGFEWNAIKFFWYIFFMYSTLLYFTLYGMMTVAVTPNYHIAAIVSSAFYAIWNLFTGFVVPQKRIPVWWRWYYWMCPVAWTLYGLIVSQFGDVKDMLDVGITVDDFLRSYLGYKHEFLGVVAAVMVAFPVVFAFVFSISIKFFNFQNR